MKQQLQDMARSCMNGAESGSMTFPQIVQTLIAAGFDGYLVDFRQGSITYYLPDGDLVQLKAAQVGHPIAEQFDVEVVRQAIRDAQQRVAGYTYGGFCKAVTGAGCAGYLVSFPGKRVLYFGRTAETHTEFFPGSK
jgi:uncharacterized protein YbcV (DUF1398 family)